MSFSKSDEDVRSLEPVISIRSTELYFGSAPVGSRYLLVDGDDVSTYQLIGAYGNQIKQNGARSGVNLTGTVAALNGLNHNIIGLGVDTVGGTPYDDSSGTTWPELITFLSSTQDTNIKVFAVCGPRQNIPSGSSNRWGVVGGKLKNNHYVMGPKAAAKHWASAAAELSKLSLTYPNLFGWTIDDFPAKNDRIPSYTYAHVQRIVRAGQRWNPDFQFFPTHYVGDAMKNAILSVRLGFTYDFPTSAAEYVGATMGFKLVKEDMPSVANLHLVHAIDDTTDSSNTVRVVKINGTEVWKGTSATDPGNQRVEVDEVNVMPYLRAGGNTVELYVSGSGAVNQFVKRVWGVEPRIITNCKNPAFQELSRKNLAAGTGGGLTEPVFDFNGGASYYAPGAGFSGSAKGEVNARYRYVAACPRTILVYSNDQGEIESRLGLVFQAYNRSLPSTGLLHVQQGFLFDQRIEPASIARKFRSGSAYADGQLVWNYPTYLKAPLSGVFSKRSVPSGMALGGVQTTFPRYQLAIRGHYQRWTTKKAYEGSLKFKVATLGGLKPADGGPYWRTILAPSSSAWPHVAATAFYNRAGVAGYTTPETASNLSPASKIVFETFVTGGYGDSYIQARLSASVDDVFLSESAWDFKSGITGSIMSSMYNSVKGYYDEVATARDSLRNKIIERKAGRWTIYTPSDGDTVFVESDGERRRYNATRDEWKKESIIPASLTVTGTIDASGPVHRGGLFSARRDAAQSFNFTNSFKSSSITWNKVSLIDEEYYSGSAGSPAIEILANGIYRISYGTNWYQTGSCTLDAALKIKLVSSSYSAGEGHAAYTSSIRTVPASAEYVTMWKPSGGTHTRGSTSVTTTTELNSNDVIQLYAEHIAGTLPCELSTETDQAWIFIEKLK